jgi:acetylornithine deacetylase/succinyl-diaminopimelate desuccinylase-like protein
LLEGGHAVNALPQTARASVNCRILPGESAEEVQKTLMRVLADDQISVTPIGVPVPSPASPLNPVVMRAVERLTAEFWPGIPFLPTMLPQRQTEASCAMLASRPMVIRDSLPMSRMFAFTARTSASWSSRSTMAKSICTGS